MAVLELSYPPCFRVGFYLHEGHHRTGLSSGAGVCRETGQSFSLRWGSSEGHVGGSGVCVFPARRLSSGLAAEEDGRFCWSSRYPNKGLGKRVSVGGSGGGSQPARPTSSASYKKKESGRGGRGGAQRQSPWSGERQSSQPQSARDVAGVQVAERSQSTLFLPSLPK